MFTRKLQLPLLNVTDSDTLVFISPNTSPNPPHRVSSKALLASGSTVFKELLGPTSQHRALRKRKLVHTLPQGIKYVIDLSPPEEGPEALDAVLRLYCPNAVLEWQSGVSNGAYLEDDDHRYQRELWQADRESRTADLHEHGTWETMEENWDSIPDVHPSEAKVARRELKTEDTGAEVMKDEWIEPAPPAAHSTRRHSAAIERILHIIHGLDPQLCTTPMWYTVCKVAVLLNCESAVVDHATSWLYADGKFIGRYPEIVMEIADDLKSKILFKDAFALLVGKMLRTTESDYELDAHCFDKIPEAALPWKRNIMHACWSLKARVQKAHDHLVRAHEWLYNSEWIPEYAKLDRILSIPNLDHEVYEASIALRDAITDAIVNKLASSLGYLSEGQRERCNSPLFTRSFWYDLRSLFADSYWELFDENVSNAQHAWQQCVRTYNMRRIKGKHPHSKQSKPLKRIFEVLKVQGVIRHDETPKSELSRTGDSQPLLLPKRVASDDEKRPDRPDSQTLPDDFNALDFQQDEDIHPPSYRPSNEPPPSYIDGTSEDLATEKIAPRGMRIEIANPIKRKSISEYSWDGEVAQEVASREEISPITPQTGNSSKRRCSLEKPEDEEALVCSVSTIAGYEDYGEPEVFHISGVHEAIDNRIVPLNCDRKGKGKAVDFEYIQALPEAEESQGSSLRAHSDPAGSIDEDGSPTWLGGAKEGEGLYDPLLGPSWDERDLFQELLYLGGGNPGSSRTAGVGAHAAPDYTLYDRIAAQNPDRPQDYNQDYNYYNPFANLDMKRYPGNRGSWHNMDQELPSQDSPEISSSQYIALDMIWKQSLSYVRSVSLPFAEIPTMYDPTSWSDYDNFLLCLSDAEWKFLPLWADGLDDGTGGVFGDPQPEPVPQSPPEDCGEGTDIESLADTNYSDCLLEMESVASFEARVFSEDEDEGMDSSRSISTAEDEDEDVEWDGDSDSTEELGWEECF